jgi:hypothetical protein
VARYDRGVLEPGVHRIEWDGRDRRGRPVASGVYFYRLEGSAGTWKKMIRIR